MASEPRELSAEDRALLERVAARVIELRMEVPAILTLETLSPVSLVAGQAMVFFEPVVAAMLRLPDYRRFAALIERREVLPLLAHMIEARADEAHEARRQAKAARKAGSSHDAAPPHHRA